MKKMFSFPILILIVAIVNLGLTILCLSLGYCVSTRRFLHIHDFNERIWLSALHFLAGVVAIFLFYQFAKNE
ncbi:hypothetical protein [Alysiella crassa]|uniref:Uncharacterized protein n=1 Tax=Alysiella crassa TaxID=153491 RepID=A0A376BTS5_9NEIS|nr:hypothetical protein [Alysiella crassa]UOP05782.1 hypothetical protein LVJ80_07680 [Alysiella crassa]UOP08108.1 hypothetical protein LVJ80_07355 [Alysiella crassa]SSY80193.1 Uncharacterised protein [Alysiella crassa]